MYSFTFFPRSDVFRRARLRQSANLNSRARRGSTSLKRERRTFASASGLYAVSRVLPGDRLAEKVEEIAGLLDLEPGSFRRRGEHLRSRNRVAVYPVSSA
jgi:hypothetical protein